MLLPLTTIDRAIEQIAPGLRYVVRDQLTCYTYLMQDDITVKISDIEVFDFTQPASGTHEVAHILATIAACRITDIKMQQAGLR